MSDRFGNSDREADQRRTSALIGLQRESQAPAVGRPSRNARLTWFVFTHSTSLSLFLDTARTAM